MSHILSWLKGLPTQVFFWVVVGIFAYLVILIVTKKVVEYYMGRNFAEKYVDYTIGLPVAILIVVLYAFVDAYRAPGKYREKRLMKEFFYLDYDPITKNSGHRQSNQSKIDRKLSDLARALSDSFRAQDYSREAEMNYKARCFADDEVAKNKAAFWNAHNQAGKFGYSVKQKHSDYLD